MKACLTEVPEGTRCRAVRPGPSPGRGRTQALGVLGSLAAVAPSDHVGLSQQTHESTCPSKQDSRTLAGPCVESTVMNPRSGLFRHRRHQGGITRGIHLPVAPGASWEEGRGHCGGRQMRQRSSPNQGTFPATSRAVAPQHSWARLGCLRKRARPGVGGASASGQGSTWWCVSVQEVTGSLGGPGRQLGPECRRGLHLQDPELLSRITKSKVQERPWHSGATVSCSFGFRARAGSVSAGGQAPPGPEAGQTPFT